jgi:hypothetical protein
MTKDNTPLSQRPPGTVTGNTSATNAPRPMPNTRFSAMDMSQQEFEAKMKSYGVRI